MDTKSFKDLCDRLLKKMDLKREGTCTIKMVLME